MDICNFYISFYKYSFFDNGNLGASCFIFCESECVVMVVVSRGTQDTDISPRQAGRWCPSTHQSVSGRGEIVSICMTRELSTYTETHSSVYIHIITVISF